MSQARTAIQKGISCLKLNSEQVTQGFSRQVLKSSKMESPQWLLYILIVKNFSLYQARTFSVALFCLYFLYLNYFEPESGEQLCLGDRFIGVRESCQQVLLKPHPLEAQTPSSLSLSARHSFSPSSWLSHKCQGVELLPWIYWLHFHECVLGCC